MADEIELDPALFTPAETPILPSGLVTPGPFTNALYPTQLDTAPVLGLAGELRGFYANDRWNPKQSRFAYSRKPGKLHGGVDIYAPSGTPIVAMVAGEIKQLTSPDDLGKRVHLRFVHAGVGYRFMIGHLDSFNGGEQSVSKGAIIGYAGCTGNAAGNQPCLTPNTCGKFSTHVHIQLVRDADNKRLDPLKALNWVLAYADDERDVHCSQA